MRNTILCILCGMLLAACSPAPTDVRPSDELPPVYPDYTGTTVPVNIAPLNFLLRAHCDAMEVRATTPAHEIKARCRGARAAFDLRQWRRLLAAADTVTVTVTARVDGAWVRYRPFEIYVEHTPIDPYLTYRLIEPDYEVFSRLQIEQRCLEDFSTRTLCDYNMVGNRCMNCHTFGQNRGDRSFLYVRGEGGGMILNDGGTLRKLSLKTPDMVSGSVYAQFSPSGRYIVFSSNVIIPGFHADASKRLEVFDTKSDVYVADLANRRVLPAPALADSLVLETFPAFAPDGRSIYYCASARPANAAQVDSLQYSLCRVDFDEATGTVGSRVDTLLLASAGTRSSVCHPRVSPDGRFLLYTVADYGTFPIWHREADQRLLDLATGRVDTLDAVNSDMSDTYHSWDSSSRWMVFASKRDDGLYGRPYICHISADGDASKPFAVPQERPDHYDDLLLSYNVPELSATPAAFSAADVSRAMEVEPETFR